MHHMHLELGKRLALS